jgi:abhydrolase domain-containing protein 6
MTPNNDLIFIFLALLTLLALSVFYFLKKYLLFDKKHFKTSEAFIPEQKIIKIDKFNINYIDYGQGPVILLLHGIGASLYIWRYLIKPLSLNYRVVAIDLPGFGQSSKIVSESYGLEDQAQRVNQFLTSLNIKEYYLIGSSMGGSIGLWLCTHFSNQVKKAIFLAPATNKKIFFVNLTLIPFAASASKLLSAKWIALFQSLVVYNQDLVTVESTKEYFKPYKDKNATRTFIKASGLLRDKRMPVCFKNNPVASKIIWGQYDRLVKLKFVQELLKNLKNSELIIDDKSGHHSMEDNPELVFKTVGQFFK